MRIPFAVSFAAGALALSSAVASAQSPLSRLPSTSRLPPIAVDCSGLYHRLGTPDASSAY